MTTQWVFLHIYFMSPEPSVFSILDGRLLPHIVVRFLFHHGVGMLRDQLNLDASFLYVTSWQRILHNSMRVFRDKLYSKCRRRLSLFPLFLVSSIHLVVVRPPLRSRRGDAARSVSLQSHPPVRCVSLTDPLRWHAGVQKVVVLQKLLAAVDRTDYVLSIPVSSYKILRNQRSCHPRWCFECRSSIVL